MDIRKNTEIEFSSKDRGDEYNEIFIKSEFPEYDSSTEEDNETNTFGFEDRFTIYSTNEEPINQEKDEQNKCSVCAKCFANHRNLQAHKKRYHSEDRPYKCEKCQRNFSRRCDLKTHMYSHENEKPFVCKICGKAFPRVYYLKVHYRSHSDIKPFQCVICKKGFIQNSYLTRHMHNHSEEHPFECDICKKKLKLRSNLIKHINSHMRKKPIIRHKCEICEKCFTRPYGLKVHLQNHPKLFECQVCNEKFSKKFDLIQHKIIHGKAHYICKICFKRYKKISSLKHHELTHLNPKPFQCETCDKRYFKKYDLNIHVKKYHQRVESNILSCHQTGKKVHDKSHVKTHVDFNHTEIRNKVESQQTVSSKRNVKNSEKRRKLRVEIKIKNDEDENINTNLMSDRERINSILKTEIKTIVRDEENLVLETEEQISLKTVIKEEKPFLSSVKQELSDPLNSNNEIEFRGLKPGRYIKS